MFPIQKKQSKEHKKLNLIKKITGEVFKNIPIYNKVPYEIKNICLVTTIPTDTITKEITRTVNQIHSYTKPDQIVAFYVQRHKWDKSIFEIYTYHF